MLERFINRPCVVLTRSTTGAEDTYGNLLPDEGAVETVCEAQPRRSVEPESEAELSDEDWTGFFFPADASYLNGASAVWIPELGEFEVVGMPLGWRSAWTQQDRYVQANLKRTAGPEDELS